MHKLQRIRVLQLLPADDASHVCHNSTISFKFAEEHNKQSAYNGTG
jgi:hypothetical protein